MSQSHIIPNEFNQSVELQLVYTIKARSPFPAEDYQHDNKIENNRYCV